MKKVMFLMFLLVIAATAMFGQSKSKEDPIEEAIKKIYEGRYYEDKFKQYTDKDADDRGRQSISRPMWISDYDKPSENDIDKAIAVYREALKFQPSGTWTVPKKYPSSIFVAGTKSHPVFVSTSPPTGGIQALITNAQQLKQNWLAKLDHGNYRK